MATTSGVTIPHECSELPSLPGSYVLILQLPREQVITAGRLGPAVFPRGYYLYVGSARGTGGVRARLRRHLRRDKPAHWHVDSLRRWAEPVEVWFALSSAPLECRWRALLQTHLESRYTRTLVVPGFGASDCRCPAHLLYSPMRPAPAGRGTLERVTGVPVQQVVLAGAE